MIHEDESQPAPRSSDGDELKEQPGWEALASGGNATKIVAHGHDHPLSAIQGGGGGG